MLILYLFFFHRKMNIFNHNCHDNIIKLKLSKNIDDIYHVLLHHDEHLSKKELTSIYRYVLDYFFNSVDIINSYSFIELRPAQYFICKDKIKSMISYLCKYAFEHSYTIDEIDRMKQFILPKMDIADCISLLIVLRKYHSIVTTKDVIRLFSLD